MLNAMKGVDVNITLNNTNNTLKPGDTAHGVVTVGVDKSIRCEKLTVNNQFSASGRGNEEIEVISTLTVFSGEWQPGQYQYPFSIVLPQQSPQGMPASYYGHYINVSWMIAATAHIKWKIDPKAEAPYELQKPNLELQRLNENINTVNINNIQMVVVPGLMGVFLLMGLVFMFQGSFFFGLVFVLLAIGMIIMVGKWALKKMALKKFGTVQLITTPSVVTNSISAKLAITAVEDIRLSRLTAYLIFEESATSGSGTSSTTYNDERTLSTCEIPNAAGYLLNQASTHPFELAFNIPALNATSLDLVDNQLIYKIKLLAEIGNDVYEWVKEITIV